MFILDGSDGDDDRAPLVDETEIRRFSPSANQALELTEPTVMEEIVMKGTVMFKKV